MTRRLPDLCLLVLLLVGGVWAWTTGQERNRLQREFDRLVRATGDLPIGDPTKLHIRAIPTGEPLHFAWRVYVPPNSRLIHRSSSGTSGTTGFNNQEFIARLRFREDQGTLSVYNYFQGGSNRNSIDDEALADLLRGRWEKVRVEQLGSQSVAAIDPDEPAILLQLTMPEEMQAEARKTLSADANQKFNPVLYTLEIGPNKPKPTPKASGK